MSSYKEVNEWATEYDKKLLATDSRLKHFVSVKCLLDNTYMFVADAFALEKDGFHVVFSEHHGFNVYDKEDYLVKMYKEVPFASANTTPKEIPHRILKTEDFRDGHGFRFEKKYKYDSKKSYDRSYKSHVSQQTNAVNKYNIGYDTKFISEQYSNGNWIVIDTTIVKGK